MQHGAMIMSNVIQDPECTGLHPAVKGIYEVSALGKEPKNPSITVRDDVSDFN